MDYNNSFTFNFLSFREAFLCLSFSSPENGWRPRHHRGACDAFRWPNMDNRCLTGWAVVPSFTWCGACRQIIVRLPPVIDCLCFFFLFSLLTTKVQNYPLCLLFVKSIRLPHPSRPALRSSNHVRPKRLGQKN